MLAGALVTLVDDQTGSVAAQTNSDDRGAFTFAGVKPGVYRVKAVLASFQDTTSQPLRVGAGNETHVSLDLPVGMAETISVAPPTADLMAATALPAQSVRVDDIRTFQPVSTSDIQNVLALMPGALHGPGGGPISINGGRPTQTRVQLDGMAILDPTTGRADFDLPADAIDAVQILPNPAGGEYGRLSAGVIQFQTRQAPNKWSFTLSNFVPEPLFRQDGVHGIRDFAPRLFAGGPVLGNRIFVSESLMYEYFVPRVYGVEETAATETPRSRVNSFTRVDASLSPSHLLTFSFDAGPQNVDGIGTGRFTAPSATPSERVRPYLGSLSEHATLGHSTSLESAIMLRDVTTDVIGGAAPMVISPAGRTGDFYNSQQRDEYTAQWKETLSVAARNWTGEHLFKIGADALVGGYTGTDVSHSVELERLDGSLAESINFAGGSRQSASASDTALFVEDTWAPTPRLKLEPSARVEHDGLIGETHVAPRVAATLGLTSSGMSTLHAGVGQFYRADAASREELQRFRVVHDDAGRGRRRAAAWATDRLGPDRRVRLAKPVFVHLERRLRPAPQRTVADQRPHARASGIERADRPAGRSTRSAAAPAQQQRPIAYREMSLWAEFRRGVVRATASYVWSMSRGDLNSLDTFFGTLQNPIIQPNEYGPTSLNVPHHLIAWSSVPGPWGLTFSDVIEYRSGFPYSAVNDYQQFVGPENSLRFPNVLTVDLNAFHNVKIGSHVVRLIVRVYNLFNRFNPLEIQNYATAPDFGTAYSHVERRVALDFDLIR